MSSLDHSYTKNVSAQEIRNEDPSSNKSKIFIQDKHPKNRKYLRFEIVTVSGECCWTFWKNKRRGANFSKSTPGTYTNNWPIKKIEVSNSCEIKEKTPCSGKDCDQPNKTDTKTSSNDNHLNSSTTKAIADDNLGPKPELITEPNALMNEIENRTTKTNKDYAKSGKSDATRSTIEYDLPKLKSTSAEVQIETLNSRQHSEPNNANEKTKLGAYILTISILSAFNLMLNM